MTKTLKEGVETLKMYTKDNRVGIEEVEELKMDIDENQERMAKR